MIITLPHKRVSGIYCIQNIVNKKKYIGSSIDIYYRLYRHKSDLLKNRHANKHLQSSYNKYGRDNFNTFIIEEVDELNILEKEQYYVDIINPEYNKIKDVIRNLLPEESKRKISSTLKNKYKSGEIKTYKQNHRWRKTYLYDLNWTFIQEFESPKIAADYIQCSYNHLWLCLKEPNKHRLILGKYRVSYLDPIKLGEFGETPEVDNTEPS